MPYESATKQLTLIIIYQQNTPMYIYQLS